MAGRWSGGLDVVSTLYSEVGWNRRRRRQPNNFTDYENNRLEWWNTHPWSDALHEDTVQLARDYVNVRFPQGIESYPRRPLERWEATPSAARWPAPSALEDLDEEDEVVGNRLFAISHRDVYDLFRAWGWEDGPQKPDGHHRMVWPKTGQIVQIMPPHRPGTGEKGNAIAMKQARKIMELDSVQRFLDGPVKEKPEQPMIGLPELKEEAPMPRVAENSVIGITKILAGILRDNPGKPMFIDEIYKLAHAQNPAIDEHRVRGNLSQMVKNPAWPTITRPARGVYVWEAEAAPAPKPEPTPEPEKTPVFESVAKPEPAPQVSDVVAEVYEPKHMAAPAAVSLNGKTPELLSKVHVLDGGRYLFQGDDGALYVVSSIVRLEV